MFYSSMRFYLVFFFFAQLFILQCFELNIVVSSIPPYLICQDQSQTPIYPLIVNGSGNANISGIIYEIVMQTFWKMDLNINGTILCDSSFNFSTPNNLLQNTSYLFLGNLHYQSRLSTLGYTATQPLLTTGLKRIIKTESHIIWPFLTPLTYDIGVIIILIGIVVSIFIFVFEGKKWKKNFGSQMEFMNEIIKEVFGSIFVGNQLLFRQFASRMRLWSFWLIFLLFLMTYVMQLSVNMMGYYAFNEESIDLGDKKIGCLKSERLIYGNFENVLFYDDYNTMFNALLSLRKLDVVLADWPQSTNFSITFKDQIQILPNLHKESNFIGLFFGVPEGFSRNFSLTLMKYQQTYDFKQLFKIFISPKKTISSENKFMNYSITDENLLGIWILLLFFIIVMLFLYLTKKLKLLNLNFLLNDRKNFHQREENTELNKKIESAFQESFSNTISSTKYKFFKFF